TTPDAVVLYDDRGTVMDSVYYKPSWGGANGSSLQRFDFFGTSGDSANWIAAAPSPGVANPAAKKDFDAAIQRFSATKIGTGTHLSCVVYNAGRQAMAGAVLKLYHDENADSIPQTNELLISEEISLLNPSDSIEISWDWNAQFAGKQNFIAVIEYTQDEHADNNISFASVENNFAEQAIVINEIMYDPESGEAEFVELFNRSPDSIDVYNWKLMNQATAIGKRARVVLSNKPLFLPPKEFILVATDSSILTQFPFLYGKSVVINSSMALDNSGEDIVLTDLTGTHIDSVHYYPFWHLKNISTKGRSLERINPNGSSSDARNWSSSVAPSAATPGATNSIYTSSLPASSSLSLAPNPFSPDNDGYEDFLSISYKLPTNSSTIRVRMYDVAGRLVRTLANDEPAPSSGTVIWNGLDDKGERVRMGMYIILFEALDNFGGTVRTMKDVAVVAGKL
ncbi:MAG: lamin tail domain-containing protein, partial [Bacteroidota bacterium]|nr:lamin tail domain-containing protein [Bacteroidota bacterium]